MAISTAKLSTFTTASSAQLASGDSYISIIIPSSNTATGYENRRIEFGEFNTALTESGSLHWTDIDFEQSGLKPSLSSSNFYIGQLYSDQLVVNNDSILGSNLSNNHQITGSIYISGNEISWNDEVFEIVEISGSNYLQVNNLSVLNNFIVSGAAVSFADTASYAFTASLAETALLADTSSYAITSSYSLQSETSSYSISASDAVYSFFSEHAQLAMDSLNSVSASTADTASFILGTIESASYSLFSETSSTALTASYVSGTVESASYAVTASYALNGVGSGGLTLLTTTPTGSGDSLGSDGDISVDSFYLYIKSGSLWRRSILSTF